MLECLFLLYHNFKSPTLKDYYDLKGKEIDLFNRQVNFLCKHYEPVTVDVLIESIEIKSKLPARCFYLTFDEGFKDQLLLAVDLLLALGISGGFFINTQRLETKKLLTVDKQRFLQYATDDFNSFLIHFCKTIKQFYPKVYNEKFEPVPENIKDASSFYAEAPFYSNKERFYRKIKDVYLNEEQFKFIIDFLFPEYFDNEAALVEKYFMNWDDIRYLVEKGMDIGCHTHSHPFLCKLDYQSQKQDIHKNKVILTKRLGIEIKSITYPYGSFNDDTIKVLKEEEIKLGFVEDGKVDRSNLKDPYRLSRIGPERLLDLMEESSDRT